MYLEKRDNMGFDIPPFLIVILVILGAGGLVICGAVVMRFYGSDDTQDTNYMNRSVEQDRYMREVRDRSWGRLPRYYIRGQQSSQSHLRGEVQSVKYVEVHTAILYSRLTTCSASNTTYG